MQNKLYTIQFFSLPDDQLRGQSPSSDRGNRGLPGAQEFPGFCQIHETHRKKTEPMEKFQLTEEGEFLPPSQPQFTN